MPIEIRLVGTALLLALFVIMRVILGIVKKKHNSDPDYLEKKRQREEAYRRKREAENEALRQFEALNEEYYKDEVPDEEYLEPTEETYADNKE